MPQTNAPSSISEIQPEATDTSPAAPDQAETQGDQSASRYLWLAAPIVLRYWGLASGVVVGLGRGELRSVFDNQLFSWLHLLVGWLLQPVTWGLFGLLALAICDAGGAMGERLGGLRRLRQLPAAKIVADSSSAGLLSVIL